MTPTSSVALVSGRRALLVGFVAVLRLAFNDGTSVTTAADAALFFGVFAVIGPLAFTSFRPLSHRFWWGQ